MVTPTITLPTPPLAGQTGHITHHNALHALYDLADSAGQILVSSGADAWGVGTLGDLVSSTTSNLPVAGQAGRIRKLSDAHRGLIIDNGTNWVPLIGDIHVSWFGAKGDTQVINDAATTAASSTLTSATAEFTSADIGKIITVLGAGVSLAAPAAPSLATISTGGSLADATTYSYRIGVISPGGGETLGPAATILLGSGTATNVITVTWDAVAGAAGYRVYGRTGGSELLLGWVPASSSVARSFTDDGFSTPSGSLPGAATAANPLTATITAVGGATTVTLSIAATQTVSGQLANFGTDDTAALLAASVAQQVPAQTSQWRFNLVFDKGRYLCRQPIPLGANLRWKGSGSAPSGRHAGLGSVLIAAGDHSDPTQGLCYAPEGYLGYIHYSGVEDMAFDGMNLAGMKGINIGQAGETVEFNKVVVLRCADSGIYAESSQATLHLRDVNPVTCGVGVNLQNLGFNVEIDGISGDANGYLLRVNGGNSANVTIVGLKGEAWDATNNATNSVPGLPARLVHDPLFWADNLDGGVITILGGWCQSDDATVRSALIKLTRTTAVNQPKILAIGTEALVGYTSFIDDRTGSSRVRIPTNYAGIGKPLIAWNTIAYSNFAFDLPRGGSVTSVLHNADGTVTRRSVVTPSTGGDLLLDAPSTSGSLSLRTNNTERFKVDATGLTVAEGANILLGTATGTKFGSTASQKIAFFGATPIVQPANTVDMRVALVNLGLLASGGATPLNLNGGVLTATQVVSGSGGAAAQIDINGAAATIRQLIFETVGSSRWILRTNATAEGGSNAGSDFEISARTDGGAANLIPISIKRSNGLITLGDTIDIAVNGTTGTKIGTATTQKLGFWNKAPVVQPSAYTQTYATADKALAAYTSDPESSTYTGLDNAQAGTPYAKLTDLNSLRAAYETLRIFTEDAVAMLNSVVDDLQLVGLVG